MMSLVNTVFVNCLIHSHDVLGWHLVLDIVDRRDDKSTTWHQVIEATARLLAYLVGRAKWQHLLRVANTAPERQVLAKRSLEFGCVSHSLSTDLDGIERVDANID